MNDPKVSVRLSLSDSLSTRQVQYVCTASLMNTKAIVITGKNQFMAGADIAYLQQGTRFLFLSVSSVTFSLFITSSLLPSPSIYVCMVAIMSQYVLP